MPIDDATRAAFLKYDTDGSGDIDASELRFALEAAGLQVTGEQCQYMLRKYDDDRGATLDLEEFAQLLQDLSVNTDESVQHRLELRTHPLVEEALRAWWGAAIGSLKTERNLNERRGSVTLERLGHDGYVLIMIKSAPS